MNPYKRGGAYMTQFSTTCYLNTTQNDKIQEKT